MLNQHHWLPMRMKQKEANEVNNIVMRAHTEIIPNFYANASRNCHFNYLCFFNVQIFLIF